MSRRKPEPEWTVPPLLCEVQRTVRFEEIDALGIIWHGRYTSWLEDGREALNAMYDISYLRFEQNGVLLPVRIMHFDYLHPLRYRETCTIRTRLLWSEAARLDFDYQILNGEGRVMTTAQTTQLMVTREGHLCLEVPPFYAAFRQRWRNGALQ